MLMLGKFDLSDSTKGYNSHFLLRSKVLFVSFLMVVRVAEWKSFVDDKLCKRYSYLIVAVN